MTTLKCLLCEIKSEIEKDRELTEEEESKQYTICSSIIPNSDEEDMQNLAKEMIRHMEMAHMQEMLKLANYQASFGGFILMNRFATREDDSKFEIGKEQMRDQLEKQIVLFSPEDDDDEDDETENDLTDDDVIDEFGEFPEDEEEEEEDSEEEAIG